jgi:hypothetical protein
VIPATVAIAGVAIAFVSGVVAGWAIFSNGEHICSTKKEPKR